MAYRCATLPQVKMSWWTRVGLMAVMVWSAAFYAAALDWGLPSRSIDPYLFGDRPAWSGAKLAEYDPVAAQGSAADVDLDPIDPTLGPVVLNETEAETAEILRRYRLFTHQPDEMITLKALAQMRPAERDFDPRLYQYGGLWIYPVGGILKAASLTGAVTLKSDKAFYYDHPEEFGRMYVVARAYACAWAVLGVWVAFALGRRLTNSAGAGLALAVLFSALPVVYSTAHEAKPHLPGAVLTLAAGLAAGAYVRTGSRRGAALAGVLCGAAAGMVISGVLAFVLLPAMGVLRAGPWVGRLANVILACLIGVLVYAGTNPYVVKGLLTDPAALRANLSNSTAMYTPAGRIDGLKNAADLLGEAASPAVLIVGVLSVLAVPLLWKRNAPPATRANRAAVMLLAVVAGEVTLQFVLLAAGKPGEYGRFAILPAFALASAAVMAIARIRPAALRASALVALPAGVLFFYTRPYARAFLADCGPNDTRDRAAAFIAELPTQERSVLSVFPEPAPYLLPPVDLWRHEILLARPGDRADVDLIVRPVDRPTAPADLPPGYTRHLFDDGRPARISWANKPIEVLVRDRPSFGR